MSLAESLLPDFDHEMAVTREVLSRVPAQAFDWRPYETSFTMAGLASHLAEIPRWGTAILRRDSHDLSAAAPRPSLASPTEVLQQFDRHVADVRRLLLETSDGELQAPWTLTRGREVLMSMPRLAALRRFLLHHIVHHRGQMTIYLRMQQVPVPPIYGPSADETW